MKAVAFLNPGSEYDEFTFGSAQNDYRIALDKEWHFSKETTVIVPHAQKFPLLMSL
jgi:hypothetical protein